MTKGQRQLHRYKLFCFTCKQHFTYSGFTKADAMRLFHAVGHDSRKVRKLPKGKNAR